MVAASDKRCADEIQEESKSSKGPNKGSNGEIPLYVQTSQRGLLGEKNQRSKFKDIVTGFSGRAKHMKFGTLGKQSPSSSKFQRIANERDEISFSVSSPANRSSSSKRFHVPFFKKIDWASLWVLCKEWIRNPFNMALFVWVIFVAISGAILFLVMTGMLNGVLTKKSQRDTWFEINNQILNALFTLMCLYQHPKRFYLLVLLCRWRPEDVLRLRKIYCKNGTYKPNERMHMTIVLFFLHLNCFAQYALCGLNLGYPRSKRPAVGVGLCVSVAIASPAVASVYNILSPLGRDYEVEIDQEAQDQTSVGGGGGGKQNRMHSHSIEKKYSFMSREDNRIAESNPQWVGGLFDLWDDISLAYLSLFCSCCVFGWNMDRLRFGNMYVHIVTFLLFCLAPFFIFNLAAVNIDNEGVREALGIAGFILCIFGLLYGGFWRIQMRKRYNLPGNDFCCGKPAVTDCFQWLCCCPCSLAQEVRTADYYDVAENKFYLKQTWDDAQLMLSPLPREDGSALFKSGPSSPFHSNTSQFMFKTNNKASPNRSVIGYVSDGHLPVVEEHPSAGTGGQDHTMKPPALSVIRKEDNLLP